MSTELVRCDYCGSVVSPEEEKPRNRIAALEAEVARLRRRIEFFGVPEKMCLLCGVEGPCGLKYPDDDTGTLVCMYDHTYPELIAIAHKAEAEARELVRDRDRLSFMERERIVTRPWVDEIAVYKATDGVMFKGESLREALDAAMTAEEDRPQ